MGARDLWTSPGNPGGRARSVARLSGNHERARMFSGPRLEVQRLAQVPRSAAKDFRAGAQVPLHPVQEIANGGQSSRRRYRKTLASAQSRLHPLTKSRTAARTLAAATGKSLGGPRFGCTRLGKSRVTLWKDQTPLCILWTPLPPPPAAGSLCNAHAVASSSNDGSSRPDLAGDKLAGRSTGGTLETPLWMGRAACLAVDRLRCVCGCLSSPREGARSGGGARDLPCPARRGWEASDAPSGKPPG